MRRAPAGFVGLAVLTAAVLVPVTSATAQTPERVGPPGSMVSLGDSITRGFNTGALLADNPAASWSTGTDAQVNSFYQRVLELNPAIIGNNYNRAVTGAKVAGLDAQAHGAVATGAEFVTIMIGANDACTSSEGAMTSVADFRRDFATALATLSAGLPDSRIFVSSIPDIYQLWDVLRNNLAARLYWATLGICQSMLANATSNATADQQRRDRVRQRVVDFNNQLEQVCAQYLRCRYDGGAAFETRFLASDITTQDYFHPNFAGQAKAARNLWPASFDFTDLTAPTTAVNASREPDGIDEWYRDSVEVSLSATDPTSEVRGSEVRYRLSGAEDAGWARYTGPIRIEAEGTTEVEARSVDVNGNVEASRTRQVKIDRTPPELSLSCPTGPVSLNASATATVQASDALSGLVEDASGTFRLDTSVPGANVHQVSVADRAGNVTTRSCVFNVAYVFGGVQKPLDASGDTVAKAGSTIPVKFAVTDAAGRAVASAEATLWCARVGAVEPPTAAVAPGKSAVGNHFASSGGQYHFNLDTKGMTPGSYDLIIRLDDGTNHLVRVTLR
ncbi:PxKF domain-containing protein [Micromonospora sp. NPDC048999]|uniref:PxKF domain-containing protein n=1 Tax=Micromonospora sp. NPDC048999 TaxID=3155391 RepID=UPI003403C993